MGNLVKYDAAQTTSIDGLTWTPKRISSDDRGAVFLMLKDGQFEFPVGEIYFSQVAAGKIKGWKLHQEMWQRFAVPVGSVKFVIVDERPSSSTRGIVYEVETGVQNYGVLTVPPGVFYSFKGLTDSHSLIVNAASIPRRVGESESIALDSFSKFQWNN